MLTETSKRDDQIAVIRKMYEAEDEADKAITHLRHSASLYDSAGQHKRAEKLRRTIRVIERTAR